MLAIFLAFLLVISAKFISHTFDMQHQLVDYLEPLKC